MVIVSLVAWFFVNRVSVRANQQIQLLESLLAEQKRQNLLLHRLTGALTSAEQNAKGRVSDVNEDYARLIPER
ncbi:YebO family protein [Erwinia pyrifoliae]|uniref:YebO family protein n=2 Tax=Erwinia pyrifoliae TaxID=79967 RepID=A0ABY5XC23_ERWPY|nr:YebO family protein [Erwinia pyrifoliae]UWS31270.1 YebO family protein [Erwinia pyrifoliae]UWS34927.1 YebO family protein [Erwinia pyrifoliae]UXK10850.1 YebO family protein [Erwinia pyrifoliae]